MNGFIEIYVDGWLRYRWQFTLRDYESFPFEQRVELREADLRKIIDTLKENIVPNFDLSNISFQIAYQSKMNYDQSEVPYGASDDIYYGERREDNAKEDGGSFAGGASQGNHILPGEWDYTPF